MMLAVVGRVMKRGLGDNRMKIIVMSFREEMEADVPGMKDEERCNQRAQPQAR